MGFFEEVGHGCSQMPPAGLMTRYSTSLYHVKMHIAYPWLVSKYAEHTKCSSL